MGLSGDRNTPGRRAPICPDGRELRPRQPPGNVASGPQGRLPPPRGRSPPPRAQGPSAASGRSFLGASGSLAVLSRLEPQGGVGRVAEGGTATEAIPAAAQEAPRFCLPHLFLCLLFPVGERGEGRHLRPHRAQRLHGRPQGDRPVRGCGGRGGRGCRGAPPDPPSASWSGFTDVAESACV